MSDGMVMGRFHADGDQIYVRMTGQFPMIGEPERRIEHLDGATGAFLPGGADAL